MLTVLSSVTELASLAAVHVTLNRSMVGSLGTWNLKFIRVENPTLVFMMGEGANSVTTSLPD